MDANEITKAVLQTIRPRRGKIIRTILDPLLKELGIPKLTKSEANSIRSSYAGRISHQRKKDKALDG